MQLSVIHKCSTQQQLFYTPNMDSQIEDNVSKVWIRLPYLGNRGDRIIKSCTSKIQRFLSKPVKFIVIYDTKKISYFVSNKDKHPILSRSNLDIHKKSINKA